MIRIEQLRLKNFKSFKQAKVPLAKGFTTIAGANGTGKSNLLDAILFGLGITSLKMVRASRLTDLVNSSSKENYAQVEVLLKDGDKTFELNRTIDKQGKSVFRLNGKRVTLNEVSNLLGELNVKPYGYNIVVQGDVTRIIEMNAVQRREIIDDLAGLKEFDDKKTEALRDLAKVDIKTKEVKIVLNERAARLEQLAAEKNAALKHKELSQERRKSQATIIKLELDRLKREMGKLEEKEGQLKKGLDHLVKNRNTGQETVKKFEEEFEAINQQLIASSEKTFEGLGREIEEKKALIQVKEERIENKQLLISRNSNKAQDILNSGQSLVQGIKERKEKITELKGKKQDLIQQIEALGKTLSSKTRAVEKKNKLIDAKQQELQELMDELHQKNEAYYALKAEREASEKEFQLNERHALLLGERKKKLEKIVEEKQDKKGEIQRLLESYGLPDKQLPELEKKLKSLIQKESTVKHRIKELDKSMAELKAAKAKCPLCNAGISTQKKNDLLALKKIEWLNLQRETKELEERMQGAEEQTEKLRKVKNSINELENATYDLEELKLELKKLRQAIKEAVPESIDKELEQKTNALNALLTGIKALKDRKSLAETSLSDARDKGLETTLKNLRSDLEELKDDRSQFLQDIARLEIENKNALYWTETQSKEEINDLKAESKELEKNIKLEEDRLVEDKADLKKLMVELKKMQQANKDLLDRKIDLNKQIIQQKSKVENLSRDLSLMNSELNEVHIETSRHEVRLMDLQEESKDMKIDEVFKDVNLEHLRKRVVEIEREISKLGEINMKALKSFEESTVELEDIRKKIEKLEEESVAVMQLIEKIEFKRNNVFMDTFSAVNKHFNKMYSRLSEGEGLLNLTHPETPLEAGLLIEARHEGEKLKNLDGMSGGEKALTALAFLFAIQLYEPAPFYIFDEADAALDKANSEKLAKMIREVSQDSQFIAITHNDALIEQSDQIIGVTLNQHKSSVVGLKLKQKKAGAS